MLATNQIAVKANNTQNNSLLTWAKSTIDTINKLSIDEESQDKINALRQAMTAIINEQLQLSQNQFVQQKLIVQLRAQINSAQQPEELADIKKKIESLEKEIRVKSPLEYKDTLTGHLKSIQADFVLQKKVLESTSKSQSQLRQQLQSIIAQHGETIKQFDQWQKEYHEHQISEQKNHETQLSEWQANLMQIKLSIAKQIAILEKKVSGLEQWAHKVNEQLQGMQTGSEETDAKIKALQEILAKVIKEQFATQQQQQVYQKQLLSLKTQLASTASQDNVTIEAKITSLESSLKQLSENKNSGEVKKHFDELKHDLEVTKKVLSATVAKCNGVSKQQLQSVIDEQDKQIKLISTWQQEFQQKIAQQQKEQALLITHLQTKLSQHKQQTDLEIKAIWERLEKLEKPKTAGTAIQVKIAFNHAEFVKRLREQYVSQSYITQLFSDIKIPISESYINLAIVNEDFSKQAESKLNDSQARHDIINDYENIFSKKEIIQIEHLFEKIATKEKRINILGRAGIGKSTFCKYASSQWANGKLWKQFDALFWISLRNLNKERYPEDKSYTIADIIAMECLGQATMPEWARNGFNGMVNNPQVLWLLDGHDEVVGRLPAHLNLIFQQLLDQPSRLLTSRPQHIAHVPANAKMEIIGFTDDNIKNYIAYHFSEKKQVSSTSEAASVLTFLRTHPTIWGIAHIPVNLTLICYIWEQKPFKDNFLSMTNLYQEIHTWLMRRYLMRNTQEFKTDNELLITDLLLMSLEKLAFSNMQQDSLLMPADTLEKILYQVSQKPECDLLKTLLETGIVKMADKTNAQTEECYFFVHLTFQEFYAAKYIVKQLIVFGINDVMRQFVEQNKYIPRFEIVWGFVAGLLAEHALKTKNPNPLNQFFDLIMSEPYDLYGMYDFHLFMRCLEEAYPAFDSLEETHKKVMMNWLEDYLRAIAHAQPLLAHNAIELLGHVPHIARRLQPESFFIELLSTADQPLKHSIYETIAKLQLATPTIIKTIIAKMNADDLSALEATTKLLTFNSELLTACINTLLRWEKDNNIETEFKRQITINLLEYFNQLPDTLLLQKELVSLTIYRLDFVESPICSDFAEVISKNWLTSLLKQFPLESTKSITELIKTRAQKTGYLAITCQAEIIKLLLTGKSVNVLNELSGLLNAVIVFPKPKSPTAMNNETKQTTYIPLITKSEAKENHNPINNEEIHNVPQKESKDIKSLSYYSEKRKLEALAKSEEHKKFAENTLIFYEKLQLNMKSEDKQIKAASSVALGNFLKSIKNGYRGSRYDYSHLHNRNMNEDDIITAQKVILGCIEIAIQFNFYIQNAVKAFVTLAEITDITLQLKFCEGSVTFINKLMQYCPTPEIFWEDTEVYNLIIFPKLKKALILDGKLLTLLKNAKGRFSFSLYSGLRPNDPEMQQLVNSKFDTIDENNPFEIYTTLQAVNSILENQNICLSKKFLITVFEYRHGEKKNNRFSQGREVPASHIYDTNPRLTYVDSLVSAETNNLLSLLEKRKYPLPVEVYQAFIQFATRLSLEEKKLLTHYLLSQTLSSSKEVFKLNKKWLETALILLSTPFFKHDLFKALLPLLEFIHEQIKDSLQAKDLLYEIAKDKLKASYYYSNNMLSIMFILTKATDTDKESFVKLLNESDKDYKKTKVLITEFKVDNLPEKNESMTDFLATHFLLKQKKASTDDICDHFNKLCNKNNIKMAPNNSANDSASRDQQNKFENYAHALLDSLVISDNPSIKEIDVLLAYCSNRKYQDLSTIIEWLLINFTKNNNAICQYLEKLYTSTLDSCIGKIFGKLGKVNFLISKDREVFLQQKNKEAGFYSNSSIYSRVYDAYHHHPIHVFNAMLNTDQLSDPKVCIAWLETNYKHISRGADGFIKLLQRIKPLPASCIALINNLFSDVDRGDWSIYGGKEERFDALCHLLNDFQDIPDSVYQNLFKYILGDLARAGLNYVDSLGCKMLLKQKPELLNELLKKKCSLYDFNRLIRVIEELKLYSYTSCQLISKCFFEFLNSKELSHEGLLYLINNGLDLLTNKDFEKIIELGIKEDIGWRIYDLLNSLLILLEKKRINNNPLIIDFNFLLDLLIKLNQEYMTTSVNTDIVSLMDKIKAQYILSDTSEQGVISILKKLIELCKTTTKRSKIYLQLTLFIFHQLAKLNKLSAITENFLTGALDSYNLSSYPLLLIEAILNVAEKIIITKPSWPDILTKLIQYYSQRDVSRTLKTKLSLLNLALRIFTRSINLSILSQHNSQNAIKKIFSIIQSFPNDSASTMLITLLSCLIDSKYFVQGIELTLNNLIQHSSTSVSKLAGQLLIKNHVYTIELLDTITDVLEMIQLYQEAIRYFGKLPSTLLNPSSLILASNRYPIYFIKNRLYLTLGSLNYQQEISSEQKKSILNEFASEKPAGTKAFHLSADDLLAREPIVFKTIHKESPSLHQVTQQRLLTNYLENSTWSTLLAQQLQCLIMLGHTQTKHQTCGQNILHLALFAYQRMLKSGSTLTNSLFSIAYPPQNDFLKFIEYLVNVLKLNVNEVDEQGQTALHYASRYNNVETLNLLVRLGGDLNLSDNDDHLPLDFAVHERKLSEVKFLLSRSKLQGRHKLLTQSALLTANRLAEVADIIFHGFDSKKTGIFGRSLLHFEIINHDEAINRNVHINDVSTNFSWDDDSQEYEEEQISKEDEANEKENHIRWWDLRYDYYQMLGIEIDNKNIHQMTRKIISHLITNEKLDINASDESKQTPLHYAAKTSDLNMCQLLLSLGADPWQKDRMGNIPLHYALRRLLPHKRYGYDLALMPLNTSFTPRKKVLYVEPIPTNINSISNSIETMPVLKYKIIDPQESIVTGTITQKEFHDNLQPYEREDIDERFDQALKSKSPEENLVAFLPHLLKITASRGHTEDPTKNYHQSRCCVRSNDFDQEVIKYLMLATIKSGSSLNMQVPLAQACMLKDARQIEKILGTLSLRDFVDHENNNCLMIAILYDFFDIAMSYVNKVNHNQQNRKGQTALMLAAAAGQAQLIDALLSSSSNLHLTDYLGQNAFFYLPKSIRSKFLEKFIRAGLDYARTNRFGRLPLSFAEYSDEAAIKLIAQNKLTLASVDFNGKCLYDFLNSRYYLAKGYHCEASLMNVLWIQPADSYSCSSLGKMEKNKILLTYTLMDPQGKEVDSHITRKQLYSITTEGGDRSNFLSALSSGNMKKLKPFFPYILKITSQRNHTIDWRYDCKPQWLLSLAELSNSITAPQRGDISKLLANLWQAALIPDPILEDNISDLDDAGYNGEEKSNNLSNKPTNNSKSVEEKNNNVDKTKITADIFSALCLAIKNSNSPPDIADYRLELLCRPQASKIICATIDRLHKLNIAERILTETINKLIVKNVSLWVKKDLSDNLSEEKSFELDENIPDDSPVENAFLIPFTALLKQLVAGGGQLFALSSHSAQAFSKIFSIIPELFTQLLQTQINKAIAVLQAKKEVTVFVPLTLFNKDQQKAMLAVCYADFSQPYSRSLLNILLTPELACCLYQHQKNISLHDPNDANNPLHIAINRLMTTPLLDDPNERERIRLHAYREHFDSANKINNPLIVQIEKLCQHFHLINEQNRRGETPLMLAVKKRCLPIIKKLLDSGASVNLKDSYGKTVLQQLDQQLEDKVSGDIQSYRPFLLEVQTLIQKDTSKFGLSLNNYSFNTKIKNAQESKRSEISPIKTPRQNDDFIGNDSFKKQTNSLFYKNEEKKSTHQELLPSITSLALPHYSFFREDYLAENRSQPFEEKGYFKTFDDGNCLFHAVYGELTQDKYIALNAPFLRKAWVTLLCQFSCLADNHMPASLRGFLESILQTVFDNPNQNGISNNKEVLNLILSIKAKIAQAAITCRKLATEIKEKILQDNSKIKPILVELLALIKKSSHPTSQEIIHRLTSKTGTKIENLLVEHLLENYSEFLQTLMKDAAYLDNLVLNELERFVLACDPVGYPSAQVFNEALNTKTIIQEFLNNKTVYRVYLEAISKNSYYVYTEEIPIIASLGRTKIHLWYSKDGKYHEQIFEPHTELSKWINDHCSKEINVPWNKVSEAYIYHEGLHYSRADAERIKLLSKSDTSRDFHFGKK